MNESSGQFDAGASDTGASDTGASDTLSGAGRSSDDSDPTRSEAHTTGPNTTVGTSTSSEPPESDTSAPSSSEVVPAPSSSTTAAASSSEDSSQSGPAYDSSSTLPLSSSTSEVPTTGEATSTGAPDSASSQAPGSDASTLDGTDPLGSSAEASSGADGGTDPNNCASGCLIDDVCVPEGTVNSSNLCEVCSPNENATAWSSPCAAPHLCVEWDGSATCGCEAGLTGNDCQRCLVYVDAATGDDQADGRSWGTALASLQTALSRASAEGCEVWVAEGTYVPETGSSYPREATFSIAPGVDVYGGFAGDEALFYQRNLESNETILSGDIQGNDSAEASGFLDDNAYHVVSIISAGERRLDGFTIVAGNADYLGAGLLLDSTSVTVANCTLRDHRATRGAAVYASFSTSTFDNCRFETNHASDYGGAIGILGGSLTASDSTFWQNEAGQEGGAIWVNSDASIAVDHCNFEGNYAGTRGAGLGLSISAAVVSRSTFANNEANLTGAAIDTFGATSSLTVDRSIFSGNNANVAGAVNVESLGGSVVFSRSQFSSNSSDAGAGALNLSAVTSALVENCSFQDNSTDGGGGGLQALQGTVASVVNSQFYGNWAAGYGGALLGMNATVNVLSSSFTDNEASFSGGALALLDGQLNMHNSISWDNTSPSAPEITATNHEITHCDIEDWCIPQENCEDGNINADPLFYSVFNLRLQTGSPAIDTGTIALLPLDALDLDLDEELSETLPLDYDEASRVVGGSVDMGAFEVQAP